MNNEDVIRVGIVEDVAGLRQTLIELLSSAEDIEFGGGWETGEAALNGAAAARPDIMLMDINLPGMNGVECVQQLKPRMPDTEFMMLTIFEDHQLVYGSLVAGATGYLVKKTRPEELLEAIHELFDGGSPMSSSIARKVVAAFTTRRPHDESSETDVLSEREREILEMLSQGMRYKEIAAKIYLSVHTIRTHLHNIYQKLHVTSKSEAIQVFRNQT
jgi:DNA-binding NarL/FixJ family response regulator